MAVETARLISFHDFRVHETIWLMFHSGKQLEINSAYVELDFGFRPSSLWSRSSRMQLASGVMKTYQIAALRLERRGIMFTSVWQREGL